MTETAKRIYCSFCGKHDREVACLIAGPDSFICDECVKLCDDIVHNRSSVPDYNGDIEYLSWDDRAEREYLSWRTA